MCLFGLSLGYPSIVLFPQMMFFQLLLEMTVLLLKSRKDYIEENSSNCNQVLKDMRAVSCNREGLAVSLKDLKFEQFIKSDTRPAITTNYLVIASVPFKVRKLVVATA